MPMPKGVKDSLKRESEPKVHHANNIQASSAPRTQDEEVGDGTTTSVIPLAGEMLHVAEAFIEKSYHPTVICRAYNKALEDAIAVLDKIAMSIHVNDRATVLGLVKGCIGTKFTSQFGDLIAG
ncbi:unnamed protein product [Eruca vesicaria subsp. sativa]|uniref:Uncharacterized protein n=1 Tax=Eruca vesicaria subsp. sativa TaxID=29727 RepID=A0ABC8K7J8_ERUVS|nr:unnamed protein product [Eruca vesicaria subsp. sativa]